ncbi:MAG: hypothetical protein EU529_01840 [Promethearchaeota archaeon]|nr:MAG: hypothetical protein EU529_01840 [Candidatus Lokiarchaeota archaeon]
MKSKNKCIILLGFFFFMMFLAGFIQNFSNINVNTAYSKKSNIKNPEGYEDLPVIEIPKCSIKEDWHQEWALSQSSNYGHDIVIDASDNVYIMGGAFDPNNNQFPIAIVKYNSNGEYQWNTTWYRLDGEVSGVDIAIDGSGNLYVTGTFFNSTSWNNELLIVKFNSEGIYQWDVLWKTDMHDIGYGIALDSNNNIYVAGEIAPLFAWESGKNLTVVKFDASGNYLWNYTIGSSDDHEGGYGICIDDADDIYVCGYTETYADDDFIIIKLDSLGNQIWNATWGGGWWDYAYSIDIDSNLNVFVSGRLNDAGPPPELCLVKFNSTGHYKWNYTYDTNGIKVEYTGVAVDSFDDIYLSGYYTTDLPFPNENIILLKFNNTGYNYWNKSYDYDNEDEYAYDIALDSEENIILGGYRFTGLYDYFLTIKIVQTPGEFNLYLDGTSPSLNGSYTVYWDNSDGAENYTLYEHNSYISEVNDSLDNKFEGLKALKYNFHNKQNGTYYYKVVSFNRWGNESSNCIQVEVKRAPPGAFVLSTNAGSPNINNSFTINWTVSQNAQNYSLYQNDTFIIEVDDTIKIDEGLTNYSYIFSDLANGTYYYKVVAFNINGNSSSNCIQIDVKRYPPGAFTLESDALTPDKDGCFTLNWTKSLYAESYSVYQHTAPITEFNNSIRIAAGVKDLIYHISNLNDGDYYFGIVAFNVNGNRSSNIIYVEVINAPPGPFEFYNNATDPEIHGIVRSWWNKSLDCSYYKLYIAREPIDFTKPVFNINLVDGINISYINKEYTYLLYLTQNGKWYIRLVSFNRNGNYTYPLQIEINVSLAPKPLTLTSNAGSPSDNDGNFKLNWNIALEYSYFNIEITNYSLYYSTQAFIFGDIGNLAGVKCLKSNITTLNYHCSGYKDGTHYFMIVAYNPSGNSSSNCLAIKVQLLIVPDDDDDDDDDDGGTDDNVFFIIVIGATISGAAAGATIILLRKRKKKRIKKLNKIGTNIQNSNNS